MHRARRLGSRGEAKIIQQRDLTAPAAGAAPASLAVQAFPGAETLRAWWADLEARADGGFYLSWHWVGALLAESAIEPLVVTARAGGRLVAIGLLHPAVQRRHRGLLRSRRLFLNETGDAAQDVAYIEYNGFLVDRAYGAALEERLVAFLAGSDPASIGLPDWDEIRFGGVPGRYRQFALASGMAVHVIKASGTARVDLDAVRASGKNYLEQLSANTRHQVRRSMRGYAEHGPLAIDAAATEGEAYDFLDALARLHQAYWTRRGQPGAFASPFMIRLHRRIIASALPRGEVELLRVRAGDQTVGYLYNFVHRGWVGAYCSGFAYGENPKLKPGYVAYVLCVGRHLALGNHAFDFLAGDNRYKTSLGKADQPLFHFDLQRPRMKLKLEAALRNLAKRIPGIGRRD